MKTLIVIAFAAVALFACLPEPTEAATTLTYDKCGVYFKYAILKLYWTNQLTEDNVCKALNNYLICIVHVYESTNTDLTDAQKEALEEYFEELAKKYNVHCNLNVDAAFEQVRRKRSAQ